LRYYFFILGFLLSLVIACTPGNPDSKGDEILARVHKEYLHKSELNGIVPDGSSISDSIAIVRNYINTWIRNHLVLEKAESNLIESQKDFRKQLENYRNSLIIYQYETNLIRQNLDTVITDQEIDEYYEKNKQNFRLSDNIVKVHFVVMGLDASEENPIKLYLESDLPEDHNLLEEYCKNNAVDYYLEEQWIYFADLLNLISIETQDPVAFLESTNYLELEDPQYKYYIRIQEYRTKESESPLSFERETIRSIIINKRKVELIEQMRHDVYESALQNNEFELY